MPKIILQCVHCHFRTEVSWLFLLRHCFRELIPLLFRCYPSISFHMLSAMMCKDLALRKQLLKRLEKSYACPECGKYGVRDLSDDL